MNKILSVPILIYHSIANDHTHPWSILSIPLDMFERQLYYLHRNNFKTITLYELYSHIKYGTSLPDKPVVLTFDDGYLDNWVHAFPLLKKYRLKATIFLITDFINPTDECRPTIEDVWKGKISKDMLQWWGFLSLGELKEMYKSGLVDIQSHTKTHTWCFTGDRIIDFHHPGDEYVWLYWNLNPQDKYRWLQVEIDRYVPWGTPVYEFDRALLNKRYYEDHQINEAVVDYVRLNGSAEFFKKTGWKLKLYEIVEEYLIKNSISDHYESYKDYVKRVTDELAQSKRVIETQLNKTVDFLCWPGGRYTESIHRLAIGKAGYKATVTTENTLFNKFGCDPTKLGRTYFGHDYKGPMRNDLVFAKFYAALHKHRGIAPAQILMTIINRVMSLFNLLNQIRGNK